MTIACRIIGPVLLFALPAIMWYTIDKGFLIYIYTFMGDALGGLLMIFYGYKDY